MSNKGMKVLINGKEGMFNVEKYCFFHSEHETTKGMNEQYKGIRKELVKLLKNGEVSVDVVDTTDVHWKSKVRLIVKSWGMEVEYRPLTYKNDFSDITTYKFVNEKQQMDYVMKTIKSFGLEILGELPEEVSLYTQELRVR